MRLTFLIYFLLLNLLAYSQTLNKESIELTTQIRREKQADYTTRYGNVSYQNALQLYGTSIGLDIGYKRSLKRNWFIKPSLGFYKFSVDKIINNRIRVRPDGPTSYRPIHYQPDSMPFGYSTGKYHYNNFTLGFAFGKAFSLSKNIVLTTDVSFAYLTTFSQHYRVENGYKTTNNKSFGYLFDYKVGVQKEFGKLYLASSLIIPLYKEWKKDAVFLENPNDKVHTRLGGYGLSFTVGKSLK